MKSIINSQEIISTKLRNSYCIMTTNKFSDGVEKGTEYLQQAVSTLASKKEGSNYLLTVPDFEDFQEPISNLFLIIGEQDWGYKITLESKEDGKDEEARKKLEEDIESFNSTLDEKSRDYLLLLTLQLTLQQFLNEYAETQKGQSLDYDESSIKIEEYTISAQELAVFNKISLLIDLQFQIYLGHLPSSKANFYQLILQASEALLNLGSFSVDKFFYYLESRQSLIQQKLFDPKLTSDRISILEICNGLTDRYYTQNSINGKRDSYKKDSFNDRLQYRVRTFITNVFQFEDNTGLNKYFSNANRIVRETAPVKAKSWEDELLQDLVKFSKIIHDPFFYLKPNNSRQLSAAIDTLNKLYDFLFEEEEAFLKSQPKVDQFLVKPEKSKSEQQYLKEKYEKKVFVPENYWLSPFESNQRNSNYELQREDEKYFMKQLDDTKTRHVLLVQVYLVACLFYHLVGSNRKTLLKDIGAPSNVKHLTDDSTPESYVNELFKIRREILKKYRSVDNQLGFLLQQLQNSELNWWGWLIYSKDSRGLALHANRQLVDEELAEVSKKTAIVIPYKEKRYFNTYATPQLSRKMKVQTGLDKLKMSNSDNGMEEDDRIAELTEKINACTDKAEREHLVEQRTVIIWKELKTKRQANWLKFGQLLTAEMLTDTEAEREERERKEREKEEAEAQAKEQEELKQKENEEKDKTEDAGPEPEAEPSDEKSDGHSALLDPEEAPEVSEVPEVSEDVNVSEAAEPSVDGEPDTQAKATDFSRKRARDEEDSPVSDDNRDAQTSKRAKLD